MIKENRKLALQDLSGRGNDCSFEVNWNNSKLIEDSKYIRIRINDNEAVISKNHLFTLLLLLGNKKQQERLVNTSTYMVPVRNYSTVVNVKCTKKMNEGDVFGLPLTVSINKANGKMTIKS